MWSIFIGNINSMLQTKKHEHVRFYFTLKLPLIDSNTHLHPQPNATNVLSKRISSAILFKYCALFPVFNFFFVHRSSTSVLKLCTTNRSNALQAFITCTKAKQQNMPKRIVLMFTHRHCHTSAKRNTNSKIVSGARNGIYLSFKIKTICPFFTFVARRPLIHIKTLHATHQTK